MEIRPQLTYRRKSFQFKDFKKFDISEQCFEQQYYSIYKARLRVLKDYLLEKAKIKWARNQVITLAELFERNESDTCVIIGTLYKHQELKPSILHELNNELQLQVQPARINYASFKDILYLEDETLRIKLIGNHINIQDVVTGIVCAVCGHELENGEFLVIDWCLPGCCPKLSILDQPLETQGKILIISGNSIRGSLETHNYKKYFETKPHDEAIFRETANITHKLDNLLCPIVKCCSVILMPGEFDPTSHTLPQQRLHPCILPQCSRFKSFHGVTNPWIGSINSRIVAGSSAQPIADIMKVAGLVDISPLMWLERTLLWRHYAPTAPDTIPTYPSNNIDPFIITECPDIYFVGNMDKYDTKLFTANEGQTIRLICIPKFSKTQTGVLVDLETLETCPISFTAN